MTHGDEELALEAIATPESVRDEWTELAERSRNVFATWEWASEWWQHFGLDGRLLLTGCRDSEGALVGVLPAYLWRARPFRIVRFLGHDAGDELGPICAEGDRPRVARALVRAVERWRCDLLLAQQLPAAAAWGSLLRARTLSCEGSPVLRVAGQSWEELLAARSKNFREQVRRRERKLGREHELSFRLADDPDRQDADFDAFFALHSAARPKSSSFGGMERFQRQFAARARERGWLRLWFLEVDGEPRAAWYGFRFAGDELYYQAGRDPEWDRYSVGFVMLAHSIRAAVEDGVRDYRFLRGHEPFKYRFASHDPGLETVGLARGPTGSLALLGAAASRSLRRRTASAPARRSSREQ